MTLDANDTETPSTSAPLPETAAPEVKTEAAPIVDKGGETPAAPPAASATETPAATPVVDAAGDQLTPEEQDVMARLTGQKTEEKTKTDVVEAPATPAAAKVETPPVETAVEIGGIKLPTTHELAGYKPETRKRIEQFTAKLKEVAPAAEAFTGLVDRYRENGVTPEQFHAWQDLGLELRSKDPAVREAAIGALHDLALKTGLKVAAPEPDNKAVLDKIAELEKGLEIEPAHAEALRTAVTARKAAAPAAPAPAAQPSAPDPRAIAEQAVQHERVAMGRYAAQEALAEATAAVPVADHATFQQEVLGEVAKLEAALQNNPAELNNTLKWGSRMRAATKIVLARRQAQAPAPTKSVTTSLRSTTPNVGQTDEPQPGTEEYELGVLTGKIQVKRQ